MQSLVCLRRISNNDYNNQLIFVGGKTLGMEIWKTIQTVEACEDVRDGIRDAANDVEDAYEENVELNQTVTDYNENITYVSRICSFIVPVNLTL